MYLTTVLQSLFEEIGVGDRLFGLKDLEHGHLRVRIRIIINVDVEGARHYVLEHGGNSLLVCRRPSLFRFTLILM